ncbi:BadF-type ATPase [Cnuella takakiae]|uniref:BadF-type ATPase n=1 Tax=Cnuella takakiae TaxID=1302690 RepID=A0A1M4UMY2_9BACT|nr:N-acetylglucosamine kinase [Cnuella takakiae]OLY92822.1 N-acetylglucosamine kinase [Cnuella takakiae]SHE58008.1 BadF-type ATPase [Cnuella takakiae]
MQPLTLIADSGSTKAEWRLPAPRKKSVYTQGISPYFLNTQQIVELLQAELLPQLKKAEVEQVYYYGTGCANPENAKSIKKALQTVFPQASITVDTDLMAAARAGCGHEKGLACILGTGSNSCYFNGKKITRNSPGLGYVLGDEGSGAYLGKKVLQYYLYETFDEELRARFDATFSTNRVDILDQVYKKPLPNRYLSSFTPFLAENRGHYMIENIIEDGLNDFFFQHLNRFPEVWKYPVHFVGGVAWGFRDVVLELCKSYGFDAGRILKNPMEGLVSYHQQ